VLEIDPGGGFSRQSRLGKSVQSFVNHEERRQ